jgi:WD40 repeat protein
MGLLNGDAESWRLDLLSGRVSTQNLNTPQLQDPGPAFSPDPKFLAAPSQMGFVNIFDTATYRATATQSGFMFGVHGAGYSPDQQRLAIGSTAHEALTIWDVNNHERLLTLAAPVGLFMPVHISSDGNVIVGGDGSNSSAGSLFFWRAPSWDEIAAAEAKDKAEGKQP